MNNAPAYRNANNEYLAYDGDTWFITTEKSFIDGVTGGWFKIDSTGTSKEIILNKTFYRKKSDIVTTTMARSRRTSLE